MTARTLTKAQERALAWLDREHKPIIQEISSAVHSLEFSRPELVIVDWGAWMHGGRRCVRLSPAGIALKAARGVQP